MNKALCLGSVVINQKHRKNMLTGQMRLEDPPSLQNFRNPNMIEM